MPKAGATNLRSLSCRAEVETSSKLLTQRYQKNRARVSSTALGNDRNPAAASYLVSFPLRQDKERRMPPRYSTSLRRNLELVAVGIAEINRVCDLVILEFEFDSALFEFALRPEEIFPVRAKRQMKHSNFAVRGRFRLLVRGEQGDPGVSFANKSRHPVPHAIMKSLEPENVDVPFGRSFDIAHAERNMINSFEVEHSEIDLRLQNDSAQSVRIG